MKNNLPYYRHSTDSDQHPKFKMLRVKYGWEGEGKFWALNNRIALSEDCVLDTQKKYNMASIATDLNFQMSELFEFIEYLHKECELIILENGKITTETVQENLERVSKKRIKNQKDYKIRISEKLRNCQSSENEIQTSENIQSKVKESKVKKIKEYTSKVFEAVNYFFSFLDDSEKERFEQYRKNYLDVADKLFRIDKCKIDDIKTAIKFAKEDPFWSSNFYSFAKLREKDKSGTKYIDVFLSKACLKSKNNNATNNNNYNYSGQNELELPENNWSYYQADILNARTIEEVEKAEKGIIKEFGKDDELLILAKEKRIELKNKNKDIGYDIQYQI